MGKYLWIFGILLLASIANAEPKEFSLTKNANLPPVTAANHPASFDNFFAKVDYEKQTIVVTATAINKPTQLMFGGKFSPTATAYLKPLNNSRYKAFVQVRCVDHFCSQLAVGFGIRTNIGSPNAYSEKRIVLLSENRYERIRENAF